MATDFEAEGLLEGLDGPARAARLRLLRELEADGVPLEELRAASAQGRLMLVPVERLLTGSGTRYTLAEVAAEAGVEADVLARFWGAMGLPASPPGEHAYIEPDVDAARRIKTLRDAGLSDDAIIEIARVMSNGMSPLAVTIAGQFASSFLQEGDDEQTLAARLSGALGHLLPELGPSLEYAWLVQQRALLGQASVLASALATGELPDSQEVTVGFADLVGFTRLGEGVDPGRLGEVAARLETLARAVAISPVRLVKTIGDEVMLASPDTEPLLDAALTLVEAADEEGGEFPQVSIGIARGDAVQRGGDWFGRPVNLASRLTEMARPGSVLVTATVRDDAGEGYLYSFAGERRVRGVREPVKLFRARRAERLSFGR